MAAGGTGPGLAPRDPPRFAARAPIGDRCARDSFLGAARFENRGRRRQWAYMPTPAQWQSRRQRCGSHAAPGPMGRGQGKGDGASRGSAPSLMPRDCAARRPGPFGWGLQKNRTNVRPECLAACTVSSFEKKPGPWGGAGKRRAAIMRPACEARARWYRHRGLSRTRARWYPLGVSTKRRPFSGCHARARWYSAGGTHRLRTLGYPSRSRTRVGTPYSGCHARARWCPRAARDSIAIR